MKNSRAPLRTSETSYLLFQQIMQGTAKAEKPAEVPKKKAARTANKVVAKKTAKKKSAK
jgi:hypothetical protein